MGNTPSILNEPLKPTYNYGPPPWKSRYNRKKYEGRLDWWTEAGMSDDFAKEGKFRPRVPCFIEDDPAFFDEKVPDGTSVSGPFGLDTHYHPDLTKKTDQSGPFFEFNKKVRENCSQYKQIAEKFAISPEHPGIDVNPIMDRVGYIKANQVGKPNFYPNSWHHYGPRFWDKPINEGSFEKGLCLAKYSLIWSIIPTVNSLKSKPVATKHLEFLKIWGPKVIIKRYLEIIPVPTILAFSYGLALSSSANIRNKDDLWNYVNASGVLAFTYASIKGNFPLAWVIFGSSTFFGSLFHYVRCDKFGLQGKVFHQMSYTPHTGPLTWKHLSFGDAELPKKNF